MPNPCLLRDFTDSLKVNALDACAERFFVRLMIKCDDYGRFHADPRLLKSALFPLLNCVRETDISSWIAACVKAGLVRSYTAVNGRNYIEVLNFKQRRKWMKSEHPPPDGQIPLLGEAEVLNGSSGSRSRSRSRGEENGDNGHTGNNGVVYCPHVEIKKNGFNRHAGKKRETWQLLRDEKNLTERIRQEAQGTNPDKVLLESLKVERSKVRQEMKRW
jgi:hypothetical protein